MLPVLNCHTVTVKPVGRHLRLPGHGPHGNLVMKRFHDVFHLDVGWLMTNLMCVQELINNLTP